MSTASDALDPAIALSRATRGRRLRVAVIRWVGVLIAGVFGGSVGLGLAPASTAELGPIATRLSVTADLRGGAVLRLPPFGHVDFASHTGPLRVVASVESVDPTGAEELLASPKVLTELSEQAPERFQAAVMRAVIAAGACAAIGAAIAGWAVFRRPLRVGQAIAVALVPIVAASALAWQTADRAALRQPTFTGLLSRAPYLAGQGTELAQRLESYRTGVADMVSAVTAVYTATNGVGATSATNDDSVITVLHVSDIHLNPQAFDLSERLITQFGVDAVVDTGDVTTWGTDLESATLSRIDQLGVPYVYVRGNHDSLSTQRAVAAQPGAVVLDRSTAQVAGLRFAGIGDPTFTPDGGTDPAKMSTPQVAGATAEELAHVIGDSAAAGEPVDVALIHNAAHPEALFGEVPLVLSGHFHRRARMIDAPTATMSMTEGSTGGAGITVGALRNLRASRPAALEASLLYFMPDQASGRPALIAYDEVSVGGLGFNSVVVRRQMAPQRSQTPDDRARAEFVPPPNPWVSTPGAAREPYPESTEP